MAHIPPGIKKREKDIENLLVDPRFAKIETEFPELANYFKEEFSRVERQTKLYFLQEKLKRVAAERKSNTLHRRGKKLLSRTNPEGMQGVLMSTGHGPCIRFYAKDKSCFKDYDLGWLVDMRIEIADGDHEIKEFEKEDGLLRRVIEISESALSPETTPLKPGETHESTESD